jgi:hypothetical protein
MSQNYQYVIAFIMSLDGHKIFVTTQEVIKNCLLVIVLDAQTPKTDVQLLFCVTKKCVFFNQFFQQIRN